MEKSISIIRIQVLRKTSIILVTSNLHTAKIRWHWRTSDVPMDNHVVVRNLNSIVEHLHCLKHTVSLYFLKVNAIVVIFSLSLNFERSD